MSYKQGYITKKPSIKSLQRIAARLDEWSMIVLTRVPNGIMIKVLNYGKYQGSENYECPDESPTSVPPNGTSIIKKKNDNKYIYRDGAEYDRIRPNTTEYEEKRGDTKHTDNNKKEIVIKRKKYSSLKDIGEEEIKQVADLYQVPIPFVISCYDSLVNYCEAHGKRYKNYLAALRNFVKNDALKIRREVSEHVSKRGIDARDVK